MLYRGVGVFDLKQESPEEHVADLFRTSKSCNPTFQIQLLPAQCPASYGPTYKSETRL